jgi:hypothetical protein
MISLHKMWAEPRAGSYSSFLHFYKKISDHFCQVSPISTRKSDAKPAPARIAHKNYRIDENYQFLLFIDFP